METRARYALIGAFMLAVIAAGFAFVYWLENKGGFGERAYYRLRFDSSVSGLQEGSAVLFNGIRVGEVTRLALDPDHPDQVIATVGVVNGTPVRSDTTVGIESQGLTGGAAVTLTGGDASSPLVTAENGELPLLSAQPGAGQDWQSLGREALRKLDNILSDNADNLHSAIANFNTFTDVLARNSDRIEGLLGGLEKLTGGGSSKTTAPTYDVTAVKDSQKPTETPSWQLVVPEPSALLALNSDKIKMRPADGAESSDIPDARWSDNIPILLQEKFIQSFENAGYSSAVSRPRDGFEAAYQLLLDIRSFSLVTGAEPHGELEFEAKILGPGGKIIVAKSFQTTAPATGTDAPAAAASLNQAFAKAASELVPWAVEAVNSAPPEPAPPPEGQAEPQAAPQGEPQAEPQSEPPAPSPPT
ncbi:ABC-type transport auxiliary lipoprotein family protein [Methyloceanibacter sp.]|uniref:ABC-type transport auxiliary lipoprotein family protein n=1 Tax=Methyloceanibacter sp. TaxID=1965321 RepID=UPI003D6D7A51